MLAYLGTDRRTDWVIKRSRPDQALPEHLVRSLTWDQGRELAAHKQLSIDTGVEVYFCDPRSRGSAAATRTRTGCCAVPPKGTDLAVHDQDTLDRIAALLNGRPDRRSDG